MIGDFEQKLVEQKLVELYIEKNHPDCYWLLYVIKDDIMTITCRNNDDNIKEICVTLNDLIK